MILYKQDVSVRSFRENASIVGSEGVKQMHLVLKDNKNHHAHKRPDPENSFPTQVRTTRVQVAEGAKHDASFIPNLPGGKAKH